MLQRTNLNESFRHCYVHHEDYVVSRLFTVPYFFVRSFRYTASSYRNGYLDFKMYRGGGRRGLWLGGEGGKGEKNFLAFSQTAPAP